MKIARVFPRRTTETPTDDLAFFDWHGRKAEPPLLAMPEVDEVHISVAYTYDIAKAEYLEQQWRAVGVPVKVGGPAFGKPSGEFTPGLYVKPGNTFTSRGCPNKCWFCSVWRREQGHREYPIKDGWNVQDDNLLACSEGHIRSVFEMLKRQPQRATFTGGLEAKILKPWHVDLLADLNPERFYCAYDTPDDYEPLVTAGKMFAEAGMGIGTRKPCCYVLIGYPKDTMEKAEQRLIQTIRAGFVPYAMLYKDNDGREDKVWRQFQREWCRPRIVGTKIKQYGQPPSAAF